MRGITAFILAFAAVAHVVMVRGAMLQMDLYLGDEKCVGHELDEDDEATFKVAATSKSNESDKQQLVVTVRRRVPSAPGTTPLPIEVDSSQLPSSNSPRS